ncbi:MAG: Fic family protein [Firmicutes bacterium]|nr:Fic family protein [Bacillota bacterium]
MSEFILPLLPPHQNFETIKIFKQLANTNRALAELKGYADTMPNKNILINAIMINEAKDSSAIENIITTHDDLYQKMVSTKYNSPAAKEVLNYRTAIWRGYELIKENQLLTTNMIIEIQSLIEESKPGIRKLPGTVLMNDITGEIIYTPPAGEKILLDYMTNLEKYINDTNFHDIDPLIKLAVIHYQFESIHPFYDGNGRTGRIINILYLVLNELLDSPILYLSQYIINNKQAYYRLLQEVRTKNNWEDYIIYILVGIEETAETTMKIVKKINNLFETTALKIKEQLPKIYTKELVELLFFEFYTKINFLVNNLNISRKTASTYLVALEELEVLQSEKIGKEKIYKNVELFNIIKNFD